MSNYESYTYERNPHRCSPHWGKFIGGLLVGVLAGGYGGYNYVTNELNEEQVAASRELISATNEPEIDNDNTPVAHPTPDKPSTKPSAKPTPSEEVETPLIVLDPGHDGKTANTIDHETGLKMKQYTNIPEVYEVFTVAQMVKRQLEGDGYKVLMTKDSAMDSATYRDRADLAIENEADLEVIIHTDHTQTPEDFGAVYAPAVGEYREGRRGKVTCDNPEVALQSLLAATEIANAREQRQGYQVSLGHLDFNNRPGFDPGNISQIQLFDCIADQPVPSVYNEMGGLTGNDATKPLSEEDLSNYATGLADGIKQAVPIE